MPLLGSRLLSPILPSFRSLPVTKRKKTRYTRITLLHERFFRSVRLDPDHRPVITHRSLSGFAPTLACLTCSLRCS
ncbi:hypothetical protein BCR43DRAFT_80346 [Syncephalastrum racemosum]|uniref:Uncharacterized protein n=1 Tax=Syncephalastrum racemosum TaxID=13706 RepID=A0A1X2H3Z2_SYNRA|nr:hypothetical protein BCR43DRAFT_80346 [Syncephalastrum racemosum]